MLLGKMLKLSISLMLLWAVVLTGCGTADKSAVKQASQPEEKSGEKKSDPTPVKLPKVSIMVAGLEKIIYLPAKLSEILGNFKEEGLDVELSSQASGVNAEQALIAGEVHGVVGSYDHTIDMQPKGKFLQAVVLLDSAPGAKIMVSNKVKDQVKTLADLKGRNIGVTGPGAGSHFLVNYLVIKGGNSSKDYVPIAVGTGATLVAAMEQGKVDLAWATQPTISLLETKGIASTFVDLENPEATKKALGNLYPFISLYMNADYVKSNPEVVQRLANAFVKTLKYINSHSAEEIADKMPKDYYAGDKDMYVKALKSSLPVFTKDGKMPAGGPEQVYEILTAFNPKLKEAKIDLNKAFNSEFVDKVKN